MKISFDSSASIAELQLVGALVAQFIAAREDEHAEKAKQPRVPAAAVITPLPVIQPADNPAAGLDTAAMFANSGVPVLTPSQPLPAEVPPIAGIERDAEGLPWDARIHASTKTKTAKGVWTSKRGMNDAALVQRVKAEIGATLPAAAPQATVPAPVFAPPAAPALALVPPVAPAAASFTLPPVALPPAPMAAPQTLGDLMAVAGPLMASGQIAPTALQEAATAIGVPSLSMLATANRPDLIEAIWKRLQPSS